MTTQVLVLTQGDLADVLLEGARKIAGNTGSVHALGLGWDDGVEEAVEKLDRALRGISAQSPGTGVLILADVPGGTPFNVAVRFAEPGRVAVLSGVNLAMVVRVCCPGCSDYGPDELADWLEEKGRQSICRGEAPATAASGGGVERG